MAKSKSSNGFSLRTKDAVDGGGTEGALAAITEIGFVEGFTYGGRQKDKPQIALHVVYAIEGFDKPWDQNYTVGPEDRYELVEDGDGVRGLGKAAGLNRKSTAYAFFAALEAAAESSDVDLDDLLPEIDGEDVQSVRPLEGRQVRLTNAKFETVSGDTKDLVVIGSFVSDEAPPAKAARGGKKTGSKNVEADTEAAIEALLADADNPVKKGEVPNLIYAADRKNPNIRAMMQVAFKESWLADEDRPWTYDKKRGVLKAA